MVRVIRDQVIAQLNMLAASLAAGETDIESLEYGLEIECSDFMLNVDIHRGLCEECMNFSPMPGSDICEECNQDRIHQNNVIDMFDR